MKNVLIWGAPRSGKSTLARKIKKEFGHNIMELDHFRAVYDVLRPQDKIFELDDFEQSHLMADMVAQLIMQHSTDWSNRHGEYFVFEGVSVDLVQILNKLTDKHNLIIVCIAHANISPEQKCDQLVKFETNVDWTFYKDIDEKKKCCETFCSDSKKVKEIAKHLNLKYFDTSHNRDEILNEIMAHIKKAH